MIKAAELRLGNFVLQKILTRVVTVAVNYNHFEMLAKGEEKNFFPIVLKPEIVEKCGFVENKKYALLPEAREFNLELPVIGNSKIEFKVYVKNNGECFGRAHANALPCSNNFFHLHQLQNVYSSLTGQELGVQIK